VDWRKRIKDQPYAVAAALFEFTAAGLIFASIATGSRYLFLVAGGFIVAGLVASFLALYGPDGLLRR
jgi:ABC-type nitrate/sulfonate/bicarbonate transport system permease component